MAAHIRRELQGNDYVDEKGDELKLLLAIGEILRLRRETLGLTIEQLADRAGISKRGIYHMEGKRDYLSGYRILALRSVCMSLGLRMSEVITQAEGML